MSKVELFFLVSPHRDGLKLLIDLICYSNKRHRIGHKILVEELVDSIDEADKVALELVGLSLSSLYAPNPIPKQYAYTSVPLVVCNQHLNEEPTPFVCFPDGRPYRARMSIRVHGEVEPVSDGKLWFALWSLKLGRGIYTLEFAKRSYFHQSEAAARRRLERLFGLPLPPPAVGSGGEAKLWVDLVPAVSADLHDSATR